ncbi:hypothetical protein [Dictyobacter kobayashii]|uniref:Uncharacterized protein n=1 Tax=Dictyobacter kobayashii TaxID=2014872 RepID=A0A402AW46_9CHLR|nr:hypothetical protein [Dictyobacter kobayashii]GCE23361.1 hypothetical protein KDK_71610 [Dictyobacter kobayashii]
MVYREEITARYKGITIWVEKISEVEYDGVFRWNGRIIKTDPAYEYSPSAPEAIESAKGVIDILIELRREGISVAEEEENERDE